MKIKQLSVGCALVIALALPAFGQMLMGTFRGKATDAQGQPYVGATVRFVSTETGRKYEAKTNSKGEYSLIGVSPGTGKYSLSGTSQATFDATLLVQGAEVTSIHGIPLDLSKDTKVDFDLSKPAAGNANLSPAAMTPEQQKQMEEQQKKISAITDENEKRKAANNLLAQAAVAEQAGNIEHASALARQTTELVPSSFIGTSSVVWRARPPSWCRVLLLAGRGWPR